MPLSKLLKTSLVSALSIPVILTVASTASAAAVPIVGAPLVVKSIGVDAVAGDVRWILPGRRPLDPKIFGTPQAPLGFEPDVGLPISQRLTNAAGTAWTTTRGPTPFSNNSAFITGDYHYKVTDITLDDTRLSKDKIDFTTTFTSPTDANGAIQSYKVIAKRIIPVGPVHTFLGGVGTNFDFHGTTGIGTKLMPTMPTQVAFWGVGSLEVNGVVVATNRLVHLMTTCNTRDADYNLVFDDGVDCSRTHTHVILPNIEITPNGPATSPVPTQFILPNGVEQPFIHTMFENVHTWAAPSWRHR